MIRYRKFLYYFFSFLILHVCVQGKEIQQDLLPKQSNFLKKFAALSNKEKFLFIYEMPGGNTLPMHVLLYVLLYTWNLFFKKQFDEHPEKAKKILSIWYVPSLFQALCNIGFWNRQDRDHNNSYARLEIIGSYHPLDYKFYIPTSFLIAAFETYCQNFIMGKKIFDNMFKFNPLSFLVNLFLVEKIRIKIQKDLENISPLLFYQDRKWCLAKKADVEQFKKYFFFYDNNARREIMDNIINCACEDYGCICKNINSLEEIISDCSENLVSCRDIHSLLLKNISDNLKLAILKKHTLSCYNSCKDKIFYFCLCHLQEKQVRINFVQWFGSRFNYCFVEEILKVVNTDNFIRNFEYAQAQKIDFYHDIYLLVKDFLAQELEKQKQEDENLFHTFFSAIGYYVADEGTVVEKIFFEICKDIFELIKSIQSDNQKLLINDRKYDRIPIEFLLRTFHPLQQKLFEYIVRENDLDAKKILERFLLKLFKKIQTITKDCCQRLILYATDKKIDFNIVDDQGNTILHYYLKNYASLGCQGVEHLIRGGADLNVTNKDGLNPLDFVDDHYTELICFLSSKGALKNASQLLFNMKNFLTFEDQNKYIFIKKLVEHLLTENVKTNVRTFFDARYPNFIDDPMSRENNDSLILCCMKYHLENDIENDINASDEKIFKELAVTQNCMIELCQNSIRYKTGKIFGGNLPALYGDWLLQIVCKRIELESGDCKKNNDPSKQESSINQKFYEKKIKSVDAIFTWFLKQKYSCGLTRYCAIGQNIFHKIAWGGLCYYVDRIFAVYKDNNSHNMYDALTQKGVHEGIVGQTPLEMAKKQADYPYATEQNKNVYNVMQKTLEDLEKEITPKEK